MAASSQEEGAKAYERYVGTSRAARQGGHAEGVRPRRGQRGLERPSREDAARYGASRPAADGS